MGYEIEIADAAKRQLRKLEPQIRDRVALVIDRLSEEPRPPRTRKLSGYDDIYRLRVGRYRVLYRIDDGNVIVLVLKVGHRRDVYRR